MMNPRRLRALLASSMVVALAGAAVAQEKGLVERARKALGKVPASGEQLDGKGKGHAGGLDGPLRVQISTGGAFRVDFDGPLPQSAGFDGRDAWTRDRMGLARRVELEESDSWKVFGSVLTGRWLDLSELVRSELPGEANAAPMVKLALSGTPMEMTLALDAATGLPAELVYLDDSGPVKWGFGDWREVDGHRVAHRWSFDDGSSVDSYQIEAYQRVPLDAAAFRPELGAPRDVSFDADIDPEIEVERVASGHLLVEPFVEGESAGWFIFDTGAGSMVIDPKVADHLGMPKLGEVLTVGIGGKATASFRQGKRFELGPLKLRDPLYVELDLTFLEAAFGHKIGGIVGYDVLARCVAEIETGTPFIAIHDPAHYALEGASWQELVLCSNTPCTRARFEGDREGLFRLDTGANGTVAFHAPAVEQLKLLDGRSVVNGQAGGVGGISESREGRLDWFELAGKRFDKPHVSFSLAKTGAFTDRYTTGNIAQQFLAPFRMVLDYPSHRIAFVPLKK